MFDIFISYTQPDRNTASAIHDALKNNGLTVFVATNKYDSMVAGRSYKADIENAISTCKIFILVYSKHVNNSADVLKEISLAEKKVIIPVILDNSVMLPELRFDLKRLEFIDARDKDIAKAIRRIEKNVLTHLSENPKGQHLSSDKILFETGKKLLSLKSYDQAKKILHQYVEIAPLDFEARYYLSLSVMSGRRPETVDGNVINYLEQLLAPCPNSFEYSYVRFFAGILKYGYYKMNGLRETEPTWDNLISDVIISTERIHEIIFHLNDPHNKAWQLLFNLSKNKS